MSRKEASNTWHDGLVMDLNPMNTPNSVLTDNLNGTIITYNGNEHLLQNDMGNYKLKNCRLSENFVPVGLKEYGDILYIVSYNPITEETEVGSYPSPAQINSATPATIEDQGRQSVILKSLQQHPNLEYLHTDENNYSVVFADEKMKMNPGDKYDLKRVTSEDFPKYEGNDYYILDEENRFHEITDFVERDLNDKGYKFVPWDVPGWLCIKSKVFNFDKYTMSLIEFDRKNDFLTIGVRNKIYVNDPIFINRYTNSLKDPFVLEDLIKDISIKLNIYIDGSKYTDVSLSRALDDINMDIQAYEWYDNGVIIQFDYIKQFAVNTTGSSIVKIDSIPILSEKEKYDITYSHLTQTIESNIDSIVSASAGAIKIEGDFKFYRDASAEDEKGYGSLMKIQADLVAVNENQTIVAEDDFRLYLTLYDLNGKTISTIPLSSDIGIGQQGVPVPNEFEFVLDPKQREQIYYATISSLEINYQTLDNAISDGVEFIKFKDGVKFVLVTSTVFQNYMEDYSDFTTIPMKTWVEEYLTQIMNDSALQITNVKKESVSYSSKYQENPDFQQSSDPNFLGFIEESKSTSLTPETAKLGVNYVVSFDILENTIEQNINKYIIGMWTGLLSSSDNYSIVVMDKDGKEDEIEILSSPSTPSYGESIGTWDVGTATMWNNHVTFDTNYTVTKQYDYEVIDNLSNFCQYSSADFTTKFNTYAFFSAILHPDKDTVKYYGQSEDKAGKDQWLWVSGSGTSTSAKATGGIKLFISEGTNPTAKLINTNNNVAFVTGRVVKDRTDDWIRIQKSIGGTTENIYFSEANGAVTGSDKYFLAIKANDTSNKFVFIWQEFAKNATSILEELKGSKWIYSAAGAKLQNYKVCSLVEGSMEQKYNNPILKYNLKTFETWKYNGADLLKSNLDFDIITMKDWQKKESNLQAEVSIDFYPKETEFPFVKGTVPYDSLTEYDNAAADVNNKIAIQLEKIKGEIDTSRSDFRGFYPNSTNFATNLGKHLVYVDGNVQCKYSSNNTICISETDSGNKKDSVIGYCLEI